IAFFQRICGYTLTGLTREQKLFFFYGNGRNGKSTTTETHYAFMGDYAQHAPAALFVADRHGREPQADIARLHGARFVVGSEIEELKIDRELPAKLLQEKPGILNWAIEGCLRWQEKGLDVPESVKLATAEYQEEEDELGEFIEQQCVIDDNYTVKRSALHSEYLIWAAARGIRMPLTAKKFAKRLKTRQGIGEKKSGVWFWTGLALKAELKHQPKSVRPISPQLARAA